MKSCLGPLKSLMQPGLGQPSRYTKRRYGQLRLVGTVSYRLTAVTLQLIDDF